MRPLFFLVVVVVLCQSSLVAGKKWSAAQRRRNEPPPPPKKSMTEIVQERASLLARTWEMRPLPKCNLSYVKVAKSASGTSELIANRIAQRADIDYRKGQAKNDECGIRYVQGFASQLGLKRPAEGPDTFLFTFIRDPVQRLSSEIRQFRPQESIFSAMEHLTPNLMLCSLYVSCSQVPRSIKPHDFKLLREKCKPCASSSHDPDPAVSVILRDYDFIGIVERFDESVAVMSMMLNIPIEDIIYLALNRAGDINTEGDIVRSTLAGSEAATLEKYRPRLKEEEDLQAVVPKRIIQQNDSAPAGIDISATTREDLRPLQVNEKWTDLIQKKMNGDWLLHEAVNASLDLTIQDLGGYEALAPLMTQFHRLMSKLSAECPLKTAVLGEGAHLKNKKIVARIDKAITCINTFAQDQKAFQGPSLTSQVQKHLPTIETEEACLTNYFRGQPIIIITSTSRQAYTDRPPQKNIWDRDPGDIPFWVFHEDSWENAHGRRGLIDSEGIPKFATCVTDIFVAQPWLWDAMSKSGPLDQFYAYAGNMEPCDQPLRIKSGKVLLRKLAAVNYALSTMDRHTVIVWLDTDVSIVRPPDDRFIKFVAGYDIAYIPFTSNKGWGDRVYRNFHDIRSPYWRIESGVVAYRNTRSTRAIVAETLAMYRGLLLKLVIDCLDDMNSHKVCSKIWFQRNVYLDDIFVMSFVLHKYKFKARLAWFSMGCAEDCPEYKYCLAEKLPISGVPYFFSHVCQAQTFYTADWNLERYFIHNIGTGAYSRAYRSGRSSIDSELVFDLHERFNDTIEMRFPSATFARLEDAYWDLSTLELRQRSGMWPIDMHLTEPRDALVARDTSFIEAIRKADFKEFAASCYLDNSRPSAQIITTAEPPSSHLNKQQALLLPDDKRRHLMKHTHMNASTSS